LEPAAPAPELPTAAQLQAIGLTPEHAERAAQALAAGDVRCFVHELLLSGLWGDVVDETQPQPQWIEHWRTLGANGFPFIDTAALERLLAAGVDPHDLTDLVRSAQVLTICNIAQLIDVPTIGLDWDQPPEATVRLACVTEAPEVDSPGQRLHALRAEVLARDPSGRYGEPRPLALRQWSALTEELRTRIRALVETGQHSRAAALWKQHVGGELRACLDAMETLRRHWGSSDGHNS
jgi:hypothetical protein